MEETTNEQKVVDQLYKYAASLLVEKNKSPKETMEILIKDGVDTEIAIAIVDNLSSQINKAKSSGAQKDMFFGALWCIGGVLGTTADIGYIFWGAIVFGAIQFFRGVANLG